MSSPLPMQSNSRRKAYGFVTTSSESRCVMKGARLSDTMTLWQAPMPLRTEWRSNRTLASPTASTMDAVSSVEASSTTMSSNSTSRCISALSMASLMKRAEL